MPRSHQFGHGAARFAPTLCQIRKPGRPVARVALALMGTTALAAPLSQALADDSAQPPITIGAGVRTDFEYTDPTGGKKTDDFNLDSIRLYISGHVMDHVSFMFNTEYEGSPARGIGTRRHLEGIGFPGNGLEFYNVVPWLRRAGRGDAGRAGRHAADIGLTRLEIGDMGLVDVDQRRRHLGDVTAVDVVDDDRRTRQRFPGDGNARLSGRHGIHQRRRRLRRAA